MTRKGFLKVSILAGGALALSGAVVRFLNRSVLDASTHYFRIRPLPDRKYSESFLRLCRRARFSSFTQAIACVRGRDTEFEVYRVSQSDNLVRPTDRARFGRADRPEGSKPRATFSNT